MSSSERVGALPAAGLGLVGRQAELDRLGGLLIGSTRLVTLVGAGGIGKTKLAEEAGRRLHKARRTAVFEVRLARLPSGSDASAVKEAVGGSVVVEGFAGSSMWDGAVQRLSALDGSGRIVDSVLLLDNCEHVLAGAGAAIADLLNAVPGLTILATSREPIGWVDEQIVPVPPLSAAQSLELFRQRMALTGHHIAGAEQVGLAEQICRHMHGNPLCIRLAAARRFYEPLSMILEQLSGESDDMRMRWRHGPRAGSDKRHHTINEVISWSYQLCGDKQRLLFDRLSVFAPGRDLNPEDAAAAVADVGAELGAIEMICSDDAVIAGCPNPPENDDVRLVREEIRELLERLVEQSLVTVHITAIAVRYSLLESLRLFAVERLAQQSNRLRIDEPARLAQRHRYYYRDKVLKPQAEWFGPAEQELLDWASGAWSNIRRAIDTSITAGQPTVGLQIAAGLLSLRAPFYLGSLPELRGRIEQTLAATHTSQAPPNGLQLAALAQTAWLALYQGRASEAEELLDRCVAACWGSPADIGSWRERPDIHTGLPAVVDYAWGAELMMARRDPRAIAVLARAREKFRHSADPGAEAMSGMFEALAAAFFGSAEQAMAINLHNLERTTQAGAAWARSWAQLTLAIALTKHGDVHEALQMGCDALTYQLPMGDNWGITWAVHIRMWSFARLISDQFAAANADRDALVELATTIAYLAGGLSTQRARLGMGIENMGPFADETRAAAKVAREILGDRTYAEAEEMGLRLSPERFELQHLALGRLSMPAMADEPAINGLSQGWRTLSEAEQEVAVLAAAGWANSAISMRRGTSKRTTDAQMSSILQKLMLNSRKDIADRIPADQHKRVAAERSQAPHRPGQKYQPS